MSQRCGGDWRTICECKRVCEPDGTALYVCLQGEVGSSGHYPITLTITNFKDRTWHAEFQLQQLYDKLADDVGAWPEKLEELPTWIHQALQDRPPALNLHAGPGPGTSGAQHEPHITAYYTTARGRQVPIRLPPVGGATPAADGARAASVAELLYELYQKAAEDCKQCQAREAARARQESERQELMQRLAAAHGLQASAAVGKAKGKPSSPADKMAQALGAIHASGAAPSAGAPAAAAADGHHTEVAGAAPEEAEPDYSDLLTVRVAAGKRRHRAF